MRGLGLQGKRQSRTSVPFGARGHSRQAARTEATRRKLLTAAERIFARNGFEAARLEDIAASAGYTRGAFYANFKSKEDIFFALSEEWIETRVGIVISLLRPHTDPVIKLAALRKYYAEIALDRRQVLISLEFKLFALRHPAAHARLQDRHRRFRATFGALMSELLGALGRTIPIATPAASACLSALSQGLLLENLVDRKTISDADVHLILGIFFDAIFEGKFSK